MSFVRETGYTLEQGLESVGKGWAALVRTAFSEKPDAIKIVQVKEKFGMLRIYAEPLGDAFGGFSRYEGCLSALEELSAHICENCGRAGESARKGNWIKTLCKECV